jgi:hypothetical protein
MPASLEALEYHYQSYGHLLYRELAEARGYRILFCMLISISLACLQATLS